MTGGFVKGVVGQVRWAYYTAAAINGYTVVRSKDNKWTMSGTVVNFDAFKMSQKPLVFVAPHEKGEWRWPIQSHELHYGAFTAKLGPPEATTT